MRSRLNARSRPFDPPTKSAAATATAAMAPEPSKLHHRPIASSKSTPRRHSWWRIPIYVVAPAAVIATCVLLFSSRRDLSPPNFGIIIDGGSTGSRIHVFVFRNRRGSSLPDVDFRRTETMKVFPGLSFYSSDPDGAAEPLGRLLEFAMEKVPRERWGDTQVRVMATAGMRLLDAPVQGRILEACRGTLRTSGFLFRDDWVEVIPGIDEGIFAWVATNYALGTLGGNPQKTTGIIELGGASVQVAYVSSELIPHEFSHVLKFGDTVYNLYSQSFLHLGQNVAYESLGLMLRSRGLHINGESQKGIIGNPCMPRGYSDGVDSLNVLSGVLDMKKESHFFPHAAGNFSECRSAALELLAIEKGKCLSHNCHNWLDFIPKLRGRFIATENFYYTTKFLRLESTTSLSNLVIAGEQFCGMEWSKIKEKHHALEDEDLARICFSAAYIVALLHDNLGIDMYDKRIRFMNQVGKVPIDWALGAFIMLRGSDEIAARVATEDSSFLTLLAASAAVVFMAVCCIWRWRKPHFKTIYDLEKGRYILTRVRG